MPHVVQSIFSVLECARTTSALSESVISMAFAFAEEPRSDLYFSTDKGWESRWLKSSFKASDEGPWTWTAGKYYGDPDNKGTCAFCELLALQLGGQEGVAGSMGGSTNRTTGEMTRLPMQVYKLARITAGTTSPPRHPTSTTRARHLSSSTQSSTSRRSTAVEATSSWAPRCVQPHARCEILHSILIFYTLY